MEISKETPPQLNQHVGVKRENGGEGGEPDTKKGKTESSQFLVQPLPKSSLPPMQKTIISNVSNLSQTGSTTPPLSVVTTTNTTPNAPILNLPSHCSWFKSTEIHETEKNSLPEFFNESSPSKTPLIYKEYRDFMIYAYQQNPTQYLTQTACRRNLAGDICSILRVHTFLEYWGLINYNISPDLSTPMALQTAINNQNKPKAQAGEQLNQLSKESKDNTKPSPLATHQNVFPVPSVPQFRCSVCKGECYRTRYHSSKSSLNNAVHSLIGHEKKSDLILCPNCFSQGKYPENMTTSDFTRVDAPPDPSSIPFPNEWTDQEVLLLLEALEKSPDDWDFVASYVGTKNKEQCLLQFIRLPIEDPFLENQLNQSHQTFKFVDSQLNPVKDDLESAAKLFTEDSHSFNLSPNPVLSMVAFIASVVSPSIAAAAANAASEVFNQKKEQSGSDIPEESIKEAAATAVAAATVKAKLLAQKEEKDIFGLVSKVLDLQLRKLEMKLSYFNDIEQMMKREISQMERERLQLFNEQMQFHASRMAAMRSNQPHPNPINAPLTNGN